MSEYDYTELLALIADGQSVSQACRELKISRSVFYERLNEDSDLADKYARATDSRAEGIFDDIMEIADTAEDAAKARLQVDARKWVLSRMKPRKYGDKLEVDQHTTHDVGDSLKSVLDAVNGGTRAL